MYSQDNLERLYKLIGQMPNQQFFRGEDYDYIKTLHSIWPNLIFNLNTAKKNVDVLLDKIEMASADCLIPNLIMCNHTKKDEHLINVLNNRNYSSGIWTAMSHNLKLSKPTNYNAELQIREVKNSCDLANWITLVESELMSNEKLNQEIFIQLLKNRNCYFYLGMENGKPVATSMLYTENTSAGVYLISTAKKYRKKGIGTAITYMTLLKAKELKCERVDIQATPLGLPIYKSLGFSNEGNIYVFKI